MRDGAYRPPFSQSTQSGSFRLIEAVLATCKLSAFQIKVQEAFHALILEDKGLVRKMLTSVS